MKTCPDASQKLQLILVSKCIRAPGRQAAWSRGKQNLDPGDGLGSPETNPPQMATCPWTRSQAYMVEKEQALR